MNDRIAASFRADVPRVESAFVEFGQERADQPVVDVGWCRGPSEAVGGERRELRQIAPVRPECVARDVPVQLEELEKRLTE